MCVAWGGRGCAPGRESVGRRGRDLRLAAGATEPATRGRLLGSRSPRRAEVVGRLRHYSPWEGTPWTFSCFAGSQNRHKSRQFKRFSVNIKQVREGVKTMRFLLAKTSRRLHMAAPVCRGGVGGVPYIVFAFVAAAIYCAAGGAGGVRGGFGGAKNNTSCRDAAGCRAAVRGAGRGAARSGCGARRATRLTAGGGWRVGTKWGRTALRGGAGRSGCTARRATQRMRRFPDWPLQPRPLQHRRRQRLVVRGQCAKRTADCAMPGLRARNRALSSAESGPSACCERLRASADAAT